MYLSSESAHSKGMRPVVKTACAQWKEGATMQYRNKYFWIAAALVTGSLMAAGTACNRSAMEGKVEKNIVVTKADNSKIVKVATGGRVILRLNWSPGTGYDWVIAKNDASMLLQEGEAATEPNKNPMPGAPETRIFNFKALKAGTTELELHSRRPWEKDAPPAETFKVQVAIAD
jgi:inhibitor of cysteine peptidase